MKVSSEAIENSQIAVNIEAEDADLDKYMKVAYNHLVGKVAVPGFRKGKTPRAILEQHLGKDAFLREALEHLIPELYEEAIASEKIEAIDRPDIELLQMEPVKFKAVVPVRPTVKLGNYKDIRLDPTKVEITDDDADKTIEQIRLQHATLLPVERPLQFGDVITADIECKQGDRTVMDRKDSVCEVVKDSLLPLPGFAEKVEGLEKGAKTDFTLSYPEDHRVESLRGKDYNLRVKISEVKEKKIPELNDEFAKQLGSTDVAAMKAEVKKNLQTAAEDRARRDFEQKTLDAAVDISEVKYPPIMKEREVERLIQEDARNFPDGVKGLEKYLQSINKTPDQYKKELEDVAHRRIVRSLVLTEIATAENVKVEDAEIDAEIEKMVANNEKAEEMRKFFNMPQSRDSILQVLMTQKTLKVLTGIVSGSTVAAAEPESETKK